MKTYIYTLTELRHPRVQIKVYRVKNNIPELVAIEEFNRGAWKGGQSSALEMLFDRKLVSKKAYESSRNSNCSVGYYNYKLPEVHGIQILEV